ncbi:MAG TPA: acyloxyacyl hydrolase [Acidobacteriota bacterium]|nr:acyloxyacyl hydrolase [Acidobacteriota bacterium]
MLRRSLLMLAMWSLAAPAFAQDTHSAPIPTPTESSSSSRPIQAPRQGRTRWAVAGSHGIAAEINNSIVIDMSSIWVRWSQVLGGREALAGTKKFLGGQPAVGIELSPFTYFDQSPRTWGGAWHLVYEHRLSPTEKVRPVIRAGTGLLFASSNVPPGETRFNYTLFVGAGLEIAVSKSRAIQIDYRLHHVSNANTGGRNPGINAHTIVLGLAWGF